jgi:hypothetical protein
MTRTTFVEKMIIAGLAAVLGLGGCSVARHNWVNPQNYVATVTEKAVKRHGDSDQYLIFTKLGNGEVRVFENEDAWFAGKFRSSDLYAKINPGKTYEFETRGWRVPLMSWYENILTSTEVNTNSIDSHVMQ